MMGVSKDFLLGMLFGWSLSGFSTLFALAIFSVGRSSDDDFPHHLDPPMALPPNIKVINRGNRDGQGS